MPPSLLDIPVDPSLRALYGDEFAALEDCLGRLRVGPPEHLNHATLAGQLAFRAFEAEQTDRYAFAVLAAIRCCKATGHSGAETPLLDELVRLLRRKLGFAESHIVPLLQSAELAPSLDYAVKLLPGVLAAVQRVAGTQPLPIAAGGPLVNIRERLLAANPKKYKTAAKLIARVESLIDDSTVDRLHPDGGWADRLKSWFAGLNPNDRGRWNAFLRAAGSVRPETSWSVGPDVPELPSSEDFEARRRAYAVVQLSRIPTKSWKDALTAHVQQIGPVEIGEFLRHCLHAVPDSKPGMLARESLNRELMRGLLWLVPEASSPELIQAVQRAARFFYENKSGLGDACVAVLFHAASPASAGALSALSHTVKADMHRSLVETAIELLADRGIRADELAEGSVPAFGFEEFGKLSRTFGDVRADLRIAAGRKVEICCARGGKPLKSIPAAARRDHADEIEALKVAAKGIKETLDGLAARLEGSWLARSQLEIDHWRGQMIDHPVGGTIGRRLIWRFERGGQALSALWTGGGLIDSWGRLVEVPGGAAVSLWHPIQSSTGEVLEWRNRLEALAVTQPFKQAHREIYIPTDAERATNTYSNRFAAHILRQAQFRQLARPRGWQASLIGPWGSADNRSERKLPAWGLRTELWLEGVEGEIQNGYTHIATDQVRFYNRGNGPDQVPVPLETVPPLAFSEVLRDVDLFVSVASVGNDPMWADGGESERHRAYWHNYAFGELSATARTRRELLERLVPRLEIAGRCKLAERFLVVRGDIRDYKIHLGSGNVLMEPDDRFLCIVLARGDATAEVGYLPFEGDTLLSSILSKAFLLAHDGTITDPAIIDQLRK